LRACKFKEKKEKTQRNNYNNTRRVFVKFPKELPIYYLPNFLGIESIVNFFIRIKSCFGKIQFSTVSKEKGVKKLLW
jgi:hypothetical protein